MRANSSNVAGWLVPARGTCSRKLCSPSASITQTRTPACARASDRQSPTGPAPMTITRSLVLPIGASERATETVRSLSPFGERVGVRGLPTEPAWSWPDHFSILRWRHVLHRADPAGVGEVEHDAERILVLGFVIGVRVGGGAWGFGLRPAGEILAAGIDHLLLGLVEIIHPHAEVIDADLLVPFLLEQRDVDGAVGDVEPAPRPARHLHIEGLLEELGGLFRIGNDERDVAKLGHDLCPCWQIGMKQDSEEPRLTTRRAA